MNTLNFLDANVWLALLWSRHIHSEKANEWFERSSEEKFFFCRITQITVLRLLTTAAVMGNDVKRMHQAWELWDKVCADDRIEFLSEPEAIELEFRRLSALRSSSPKVWVDIYLSAFASAAGLKLITFDRALRSRGAEVHVL
jgi:toxin-antitoxin system PIN domain toxin